MGNIKDYLIRVAARSEGEAMDLVGRHIFMTIEEINCVSVKGTE